jgi:hypothetical protein
VPVRYYRVHPAHWKGWRHDHAPRWEAHWGREWREEAHERDWREREERWGHARHSDRDKGRERGRDHDRDNGHDRGKGHAKGKGHDR